MNNNYYCNISVIIIWRAYFQKGLDPFLIKFELLISRHYLSYPLPLKRISDPNVTSKKEDIVNSILSFP